MASLPLIIPQLRTIVCAWLESSVVWSAPVAWRTMLIPHGWLIPGFGQFFLRHEFLRGIDVNQATGKVWSHPGARVVEQLGNTHTVSATNEEGALQNRECLGFIECQRGTRVIVVLDAEGPPMHRAGAGESATECLQQRATDDRTRPGSTRRAAPSDARPAAPQSAQLVLEHRATAAGLAMDQESDLLREQPPSEPASQRR